MKKIARIFDGYHAVRLEQHEAAPAALGRPLVVTSERAASAAVTPLRDTRAEPR
jgi:hypothetical protein